MDATNWVTLIVSIVGLLGTCGIGLFMLKELRKKTVAEAEQASGESVQAVGLGAQAVVGASSTAVTILEGQVKRQEDRIKALETRTEEQSVEIAKLNKTVKHLRDGIVLLNEQIRSFSAVPIWDEGEEE